MDALTAQPWPGPVAAPDDSGAVVWWVDLGGCGDRAGRRLAAHAAARAIASAALGAEVRPRHPPDLPPALDLPGWSLSLAYAGEIALIALGRGVRIGIDLAVPELPPDWRRVADDHLGPATAAVLTATAEARRGAAFAAAWAELEARGKCAGTGLVEAGAPAAAVRMLVVAAPRGLVARLALAPLRPRG